MDEQTQLKDSILAQAHEKGRKLLEEAKETILKEETAQEERLIQDKLNQRSEQLKQIQRQLQRETQQIENKKRQSTLVTKQRVLKDLFADAYEAMVAWPLEKEMQFVDAVLDRYQGQVVTTGSPGPTPDVSSYTWIEASSRRISIISPIKPRSPTRQMSWILASCIPDATTKGPETLIIFP